MAREPGRSEKAEAWTAPKQSSRGGRGAALWPPSYGIRVVDDRPVQAAAIEAATGQNPAVVAGIAARGLAGRASIAVQRAAGLELQTGGGEALPAGVRASMERSFSADFSDVRIHQGVLAAGLGALAFTRGHHIHFTPGRFDPDSEGGRRLLGHELAHVVQQRAGRVHATRHGGGAPYNADPYLEAEADAAGDRAARGEEAGLDVADTASVGASDGPVQCKLLPAADTFASRVIDKDDLALKAIDESLKDYNLVAEDDEKHQERLGLLRRIDRQIYRWFATHRTDSLDTQTYTELLEEVLHQTEEEHADIVDRLRKGTLEGEGGLLPIDVSDLKQEEIEPVSKLWTSLVGRDGNIQVDHQNQGFEKKTYAQLAKLLQSAMGRQVIGYLDRSQRTKGEDERVMIVPQLPTELANKDKDGSSFASATRRLHDKDFAGHMFVDEPNADDRDFQTMDGPEDLTTAVLQGRRGVRLNGKKYLFGEGSGAYIKMDQYEAKHRMVGEHQNQILTPEFVTLGHELGHAMKMRAGAMAPTKDSTVFGALEGDEMEQRLWDNAEEIININGIDNKIREEHGVERRKYHKPLESVRGIQRQQELIQLICRVPRDPLTSKPLTQATELYSLNQKGLADDSVYQTTKQLISELLTPLQGVEAVITQKRLLVRREVDLLMEGVSFDALTALLKNEEFRELDQYLQRVDFGIGKDVAPVVQKVRDFQKTLKRLLPWRDRWSYGWGHRSK